MERKEKFTPGKWKAGRGPSFDFVAAAGRDKTLAAWPRSDENAANAALIAAAPEMYDALKDLMSAMDDVVANSESIPDCIMWVVEEAQEKAENAMKKARGEE